MFEKAIVSILPGAHKSSHKLARIVYHLLTHHTPFRDLSAEEYEQRALAREITHLREKAAKLSLTLVESQA